MKGRGGGGVCVVVVVVVILIYCKYLNKSYPSMYIKNISAIQTQQSGVVLAQWEQYKVFKLCF